MEWGFFYAWNRVTIRNSVVGILVARKRVVCEIETTKKKRSGAGFLRSRLRLHVSQKVHVTDVARFVRHLTENSENSRLWPRSALQTLDSCEPRIFFRNPRSDLWC